YFFSFHYSAPPYFFTLSLHDALPIWLCFGSMSRRSISAEISSRKLRRWLMKMTTASIDVATTFAESSPQYMLTKSGGNVDTGGGDRKSTRLNSSHVSISYAVFCLKKK